MKNTLRRIALAALLIAFAAGSGAQGSGNGRNRLPNGKPFQILQNAIKSLDAKLQQQITSLQAQLDANAANDLARQGMIDSLQVAAQQIESRLGTIQSRIDDVQAYNEVQDARLAFLAVQVSALQSRLDAQAHAVLELVFALHNAQMAAITQVQQQISVLQLVASQQGAGLQGLAAVLSGLATRLAALDAQYLATKSLLASGCPAGSSIRSIGATGSVACQVDRGVNAFASVSTAFSTLVPGGILGRSVFCPSGFFATGGGILMGAPGASIMSIGGINHVGWAAVVYNGTGYPIDFAVTAHCLQAS